jgi:hypothetical protein
MGFWTSYYRVKLQCRNCDFMTDYQIEEGVPVEAAARHLRCRRCKVVGMLGREQFQIY